MAEFLSMEEIDDLLEIVGEPDEKLPKAIKFTADNLKQLVDAYNKKREEANKPNVDVRASIAKAIHKHDEMVGTYSAGEKEDTGKTYGNTCTNTASDNVKDIVFWGDGDTFKLVLKASSVKEKWMKSTKFLEIPGFGGVLQVTTQQGDNVAEAVTFVPAVKLIETVDADGKIVGRRIVSISA